MGVPRSRCLIYPGSSRVRRRAREEGDRSSVLPRWVVPVEISAPLSMHHRIRETKEEKEDRSYKRIRPRKWKTNLEVIQTSDLILMILDATKRAEQRALLEAELEAVGIRLNREPPYASSLTI